jgi:hypothetical protein
MVKVLANLKWSPKWVSHLGCVKGCLDYLGIEMTDAWLYGGTGHAFVINISADSCPSGPTAWMTVMLFEGGRNLGYEFGMVMGWKGYDIWINGLASSKANRFGMGYNAAVWHECRRFAVGFLKEAKERLDGVASELFDNAIEHYQVVADRLGKVSESYPFTPGGHAEVIPVDDRCKEAVDWLKEARESEAAGLMLIEKIHAVL